MQQADSTALNLDYGQYSRVQKENLLALLQEKERRVNSRQILDLYPDTGPLRRELYVPHVKFFEAGAKYRERCFMAANRVGKCLSCHSLISTPGGQQKIGELYEEGKPFSVYAWDGKNVVIVEAEEPIKKSPEKTYRVWLSNGQWFDLAAEHRVLTQSGWTFFSDLAPFVPSLPSSSSEYGLFENFEDVLHYLKTIQDSQFDYQDHPRLYDGQPQFFLNNDSVFLPLKACDKQHSDPVSHLDDLENKHRDIAPQSFFHPSSQDVGGRAGDLFPVFEGYVSCNYGELYRDLLQGFQQFSIVEAAVLQPDFSIGQGLIQSSLALVSPIGLNSSIICYQPLNVKDIYDFHVPYYKNYLAGGAIHHNTYGVGGYELALHLTGRYPPWWKGKRFDSRPIRSWASGTTGQTTRDIVQRKLLGPVNNLGTGLIPGECIIDTRKKAGNVPDAIETVYVQHASGGVSTLGLKSYEQGRKAFEGDEQDVIMLDEEAPIDIYTECLTRTMTTQGIVMLLFTPLQGLSDTVLLFMPGGQIPAELGKRFVIQASWDDAPHLSERDKQDIIDSYLPHERDARSKGIPQLGSGRVFPISEDDLLVDDFMIPEHWIQAYGFDVGWNATAATWGALNRGSDVLYLHSCYKQGQEKPLIHADAVKARGEWIPGLSDPAALGRGQKDGSQLLLEYNDLGLKLIPADNPVEAGILKLYKRMTTGRLKVFRSMVQWLEEFRIYRRNDKGKIIKEFDHLMDCFQKNTLVITDQGKIKIKDLVGTKGLVLSTDGKWMPYENCKRYGQNKSVVEILFNDGSRVVCTPDHKFLTSKGWIEAIDLQGQDCYNAMTQTIQEKDKCKSISYLRKNKNLKEKFITCAGIIFSEMVSDYIGWYGKAIMEKFPKGIVSTTKTRIDQIMTFLIWNYCCFLCIPHFTKKDMAGRLPLTLLMQQQNGMAMQTESSGINSTMKILKTDSTKKPNLFVSSVGKNILQQLQEKIDFVQKNVNQLGGINPDLITSKKFVQNAGKNLSQTNIAKRKHVQGNAALKCLVVKDAGKSDVYCLEVPGSHAFAVESGAIVHNCSRYLNNSIVEVGIIRPADETIFLPGAGSNLVSGWAR